MRIERLEALAYGAIAGRVLEPGPGLTVVHGPNESGKSSTMQLLRGVLFGFPRLDARTDGPQREPKGGGQRSGIADLVADDGRRYRIERTHRSRARATCDGREIGDAELERALGISSSQLFDTVQTFTARDIAKLDLLDDGEVRANVLASAVLGGGTGAPEAIAELRRRADALYLRSGENQPYALHLRSATAQRRALRDAQRAAAGADRSDDALAEAEARVADATAELERATRDLQRIDRLIEAHAAAAELDRVLAGAPTSDAPEPVAPEAHAAFRALLGDVPIAIEARRRAEELRGDAAAAEQRAAGARARLGLPADREAPPLADEVPLRAAAQAVRDAERDAGQLATLAQAIAPPPVASASRPRRGPGLAVLVAGLAVTVVGAALGITAATFAGIAIAAIGALVLAGLIGAQRADAGSGPVGDGGSRSAADDAAARLAAAEAAWRQALADAGIAAPLRADQLDAVIAAFAELRDSTAAAATAGTRAAEAEAAAGTIADRAAAVFAAVGETAPADLERMRDAVTAALAGFDERQAAAMAHAAALATWEGRRDAAREALERLGVDADEARSLDRDEALARQAVLGGEVVLRGEERQEATAALGGVRARIADAEDSAAVAALALGVAEAETDLRATADEWLTLALARALAERARDRFVEEHQPGIFRRAAEQIRSATDGAWVGIRMPDGERAGARSEIIDRDGTATPFSELSTGTVGLVYLCLRAGLVDELHEAGGASLPVLMDDVLTDLDPERRAGAARVIADLATRHQVLYFTCHPEQVQALRDADDGLREVPLQRLV